MILKTLFFIVIINGQLLATAKSYAETYYLGVLAPQGEIMAQRRWQPWLDQLNSQIPDDTIVLVPLVLENWQQQIEVQQFALVLGPQVQFIKMDTSNWRWLATVQTDIAQAELNAPKADISKDTDIKGFKTKAADNQRSITDSLINEFHRLTENAPLKEPSAMEEVASALWVAADSDIYQLQDLQQRKIAAVDTDAFGGYLLVAHLLQQNGITTKRYQTQFVGYPIEGTLHTLASGKVDAAIAPLCLMEEMARQGKINQTQYRLIHPVTTASSCQSSTKIFPNWTLAATGEAPDTLIRQINQNLFGIEQQSHIGIGQLWLPPESSMDAERILYEMNRHPAQKKLGVHMVDWIKSHRLWMSMIVFMIIISTVNYGWMSWLAWRRRKKIMIQNQMIRNYDHKLRQSERFAVIGEMSGSIAHEINQPLATIQNYAQGLLIRSQNTMSHGLSLEKQQLEKDSTEKALQQITNETERAAAVISNIRRWAGRSQSVEVAVDIAKTYQQCILLLGDKATPINFWLASEYRCLLLPSLLLDQLLINSMVNAEQQGARHIILRCQTEAYEGRQYLVLRITDDAGGFDETQLLWSKTKEYPCNQYTITSTKVDGLGLGLMICQRLCKSLDGMMQLDNVNIQHELEQICAIKSSDQQRFKRTANGKVQLIPIDTSYQSMHIMGAQVSFYLPIRLANINTRHEDNVAKSKEGV